MKANTNPDTFPIRRASAPCPIRDIDATLRQFDAAIAELRAGVERMRAGVRLLDAEIDTRQSWLDAHNVRALQFRELAGGAQ